MEQWHENVLGVIKFNPKGRYNPDSQYEIYDVVTYNGSSYVALQPFKGIPPTGDDIVTQVLANKGDKGDPLQFTDLTDDQKAEIQGEGFTIKGYYGTLALLKSSVTEPKPGATYGIGAAAPYDIYIYDSVTEDWVNNGTIQGPEGKSAYLSWIDQGHTGTEADFVAWLKGADGYTPQKGVDYKDGESVTFKVKTQTETEYILEITDKEETVTTPNLKGANGRDWECPTLEEAPTEQTLSYEDGGRNIPFKIGCQVRVFDTEEGEYVFYQLYDITGDTAVWKIAGSGGQIKGEVVNIIVTGNQTQPDASLTGAKITVSYGDNTTVLTWEGKQLVTEIPINMTFKVSCSDIDGYATPSDQEYIALVGNTRNLTIEYNTTVTTINVTSNQTAPNADLNGTKLTLKYTTPTLGEVTKELTYNGSALTQKIPTGITYTLAGSALSGYNTPTTLSRTAAGITDSTSLNYTTERVTVNVSTDDGQTAVSGQTLTVTNTSTNAVLHSGAAGTGIVIKIPFGTSFRVSVNDLAKYTRPADQTFTAGSATRTVNVVYERIKSAQITFDKSISDPENITGEINSSIIADILAKFRRCLVKKTADGQVTISYLRDDNSNFYEDGTAAILTGTEGDVMVHFPEFYYKYEKVDTNKFRYHFALQKIDDTYIKVSESLLGAYEAVSVSNSLYSRSGVISSGNNSQTNFKIHASNRGKGYGIIDYEQHCAIAMMFFAKYGNRDSQAVLGVGVNSYTTTQGTSNATGIVDTKNITNGHATFLGIEAVHGGKLEWVDGVVIDNYVWKITNPETGVVRQVTALSTNSVWIKEIAAAAGTYFDLIPIEAGGSQSTYYADYYNCATGSRVLARSYYSSHANGGIAYTYANSDSAVTYASIGSRLAFRGDIRKAQSVQAFKALPVL